MINLVKIEKKDALKSSSVATEGHTQINLPFRCT